jgi:hypothetical protein
MRSTLETLRGKLQTFYPSNHHEIHQEIVCDISLGKEKNVQFFFCSLIT